MFSYGVGVASTMYIFKVRSRISGLKEMVTACLSDRIKIPPKTYSLSIRNREDNINRTHYKPTFEAKYTRENSYTFAGVDDFGRRIYQKYITAPSTDTGLKKYNNRILTVARHMVESTQSETTPYQNKNQKSEAFKHFCKKTLEERLKIVGPANSGIRAQLRAAQHKIP